MDDYDDYGGGPSPLRMFSFFSMLAPVAGMALFASLWGVVILYVIARWRHHRAGTGDPQLGLKFVLNLFRMHGYQLLLLGAFLLLYSILAKGNSDMRSPIWRAALGFLTSGGVVFGAHTVLLMKTNQAEQPLVGRMYGGLSLLITGLIAMIGLVLGTQALFAKGSMGNEGRGFWSLVFVYGTAWVVQGAVFGRASLAGGNVDGPGAMPGVPPPPPAPVPEPMRQPLA